MTATYARCTEPSVFDVLFVSLLFVPVIVGMCYFIHLIVLEMVDDWRKKP